MKINLNIARWDCWAAGCKDSAAWHRWALGGEAPGGDDRPELSHIKPMQRRRLSPVARAAFYAADSCMVGVDNPTCVFASTYGQPEQSFKLLQALALEEPVSPAAFSLSVHNAVAGLFSIIHNLTGTSLTICAGADGIGAAFMEAVGLLNEGETENVLLVCSEGPLPDAQRPYEVNPPTHMAACYLVTRSTSGAALSLERVPARVPGDFQASPFWQQMRDLIAFLESDEAGVEIPCHRCTWRWSRISDAG